MYYQDSLICFSESFSQSPFFKLVNKLISELLWKGKPPSIWREFLQRHRITRRTCASQLNVLFTRRLINRKSWPGSSLPFLAQLTQNYLVPFYNTPHVQLLEVLWKSGPDFCITLNDQIFLLKKKPYMQQSILPIYDRL